MRSFSFKKSFVNTKKFTEKMRVYSHLVRKALIETSIMILSFLTQIEQEISIYWMKEIKIRMTSLSNDKYFQSKI